MRETGTMLRTRLVAGLLLVVLLSAPARATLIVVVLDEAGIGLAADSRMTKTAPRRPPEILAGVEKVFLLTRDVVVATTGAPSGSGPSGRGAFDLVAIARECAKELAASRGDIDMARLADAFGARARAVLESEPEVIESLRGNPLADANVFGMIFAGRDWDGKFKRIVVLGTIEGKKIALSRDVKEATGRRSVEHFGVPVDGNPNSPLGRRLARAGGRRGTEADLAEATLAAAIASLAPASRDLVGYPVSVYTIDRGGARLVRSVTNETQAIRVEDLR